MSRCFSFAYFEGESFKWVSFRGYSNPRDKPQNRMACSNIAFFMGGMTSSKTVTERFAMQMTVVYSCVRILSKAVAGLPLHLYKVVVIDFRYLLNKKDFLEFKSKLIKEIDRVNEELVHISETELLDKMGFLKIEKTLLDTI